MSERAPTEDNDAPETETPSHQRAPFADPLAGKKDPTAPGAPHEPGGVDYSQSRSDRQVPKPTTESP